MEEVISKNNIDSPKSIFDEAVLNYANGNTKSATQLILGAIFESAKNKNPKLAADKEYRKNWVLALDMFQASKNKENFDTFALFYSRFFNVTPPVFDQNFANNKNSGEYVGRSNLNIDIKISDISKSKIEDFESATIENKTGLINFSRSSINIDDEGTLEKLYLLRNAMRNIRESKIQCIIMGETHFIKEVENIISEIEVFYAGKLHDIPKINQVYWLFLCEIYQWLGMKEKFEHLSLSYSNIFNITPPAFNSEQIMEQSEKSHGNDIFSFNKTSNVLTFYGELTSLESEKIISAISSKVEKMKNENNSNGRPLIIDFNDVIKVDYMLATQLAVYLNKELDGENVNTSIINKRSIIIKSPFEFIIRLFDITGVSNYITYRERNRNIINK